MGIPVPGITLPAQAKSANMTAALGVIAVSNIFNTEVRAVLKDTIPILVELGIELALPGIFNLNLGLPKRESIVTK